MPPLKPFGKLLEGSNPPQLAKCAAKVHTERLNRQAPRLILKAKNKTHPTDISPIDYVAAVQNAQRRTDAEYLLKKMQTWVGAPAKMWGPSIIGFGRYHYTYESGREGDAPLAAFAPRKNETVVYLAGKIDEQGEKLARLGPHKMGQSCLYIKRLEHIDEAVLHALVSESVAYLRKKYPTFND